MSAALAETGTFTPVVEAHEGHQIKARRERLGLTISALAERADVDRGHLADIEKGKVGGPRGGTIGAIVRALDAFEAETVGPYDRDDHVVTFRMSGNFGVDVTVSGPVENLPELEESVGRLLQRMRNGES